MLYNTVISAAIELNAGREFVLSNPVFGIAAE